MQLFFQGGSSFYFSSSLSFSQPLSRSLFLLTEKELKSANPVLSKLELCVQTEYRV